MIDNGEGLNIINPQELGHGIRPTEVVILGTHNEINVQMSEVMIARLQAMGPLIEALNGSEFSWAITGNFARLIMRLIMQASDFRFEWDPNEEINKNPENVDTDLSINMEDKATLGQVVALIKKLPCWEVVAQKGEEDRDTQTRSDGFISRNIMSVKTAQGFMLDLYGKLTQRTHTSGDVRRPVVAAVGDRVWRLNFHLNGKIIEIPIAMYGDLMEKDRMRLEVMMVTCSMGKTPYGVPADECLEGGIGALEEKIDKLKGRMKEDQKLMRQWKRAGKGNLPWGENVDNLLVAVGGM